MGFLISFSCAVLSSSKIVYSFLAVWQPYKQYEAQVDLQADRQREGYTVDIDISDIDYSSNVLHCAVVEKVN